MFDEQVAGSKSIGPNSPSVGVSQELFARALESGDVQAVDVPVAHDSPAGQLLHKTPCQRTPVLQEVPVPVGAGQASVAVVQLSQES